MNNVLIIGSNGGIGQEICKQLSAEYNVLELSRSNTDYSEESLQQHAEALKQNGAFRYIINCSGVLHDDKVFPEKRLAELNAEQLTHYYHVNAILPALCIKHFYPLLDKEQNSVFASLSAMVGSISDNKLGGWYGYRSSKSALNMLIKTASIEIKRSNKSACLIAVHPGTTDTPLSVPFQSNIKADKLYTTQQTAERIINVIKTCTAENTGSFYHWDGSQLTW